MTRLPTIGSDSNTWGTVLNQFLQVGHNANGSLLGTLPVFNVKDDVYGAKGDGTTDDTTAIQAAINAAQTAGGGIVFLPAGTYKTSAALLITYGTVQFIGAGSDATMIKPASGANFDVITLPIPPDNVTVMPGVSGLVMRDFGIDCSNMSGTTAGQGNGIHLYSAVFCKLINIHIKHGKNWAIMNDSNSASDSYDNYFEQVKFDSCAAGIRFESGEGSTLFHCFLYGANNTTAANQNTFRGGAGDNTGYAIAVNTGNIQVQNCFFGGGGSVTHALARLAGTTQFIANQFDNISGVSLQIVSGAHYSTIIGNAFEMWQTGTATEVVQFDADYLSFIGNTFVNWSGANATYAVREQNAHVGCVVSGNQFLTGATGVLLLNAGSTLHQVSHNPGYNPVGHAVTQPSVPATTVAQANTTGVDCTVFVAGGTVTVIAIGGTATGMTSGSIRVPAGQTITLTYSAAPTWQWFGD